MEISIPVIFPRARPWMPILAGGLYFGLYLWVTQLFYAEDRAGRREGLFKRNGAFDVLTSLALIGVTLWLIVNVIVLAANQLLTFPFLFAYYVLFIFLFSGIYSLIQWHFPASLEGAAPSSWETELQCLILSLQTITTLGPTRVKPLSYLTELTACGEAILGIFFIGIFVARWVNTLTGAG
jgi:hypothetical protein